jgi:hypothetical protein
MPAQHAFGRRAAAQPQPLQSKPRAPAQLDDSGPDDLESANIPPSSDGSWPTDASDIEDEIREWKQARKGSFKIPWRQVYVMAGLCFGLASFVVPDSVGNLFQWMLYGLAAASFYAGWRKRKNAGT